jgi:hypothetical protein
MIEKDFVGGVVGQGNSSSMLSAASLHSGTFFGHDHYTATMTLQFPDKVRALKKVELTIKNAFTCSWGISPCSARTLKKQAIARKFAD